MELLVGLLGELIFAPFAAALVALVELVAAAGGAVLELLLAVRGRRASEAGTVVPRRASVWGRRVRWSLLGLMGVTLLAFVVVGTFFTPAVVARIAASVEARTGIRVEYREAGGNLCSGSLWFEGLRLARGSHELSTFALSVERCEIEMSLLSAWRPAVELGAVLVRGARGHYERHAKPDATRLRRAFVIEDLHVEDLEVRLVDHTVEHGTLDVPVRIVRAHGRPLRSGHALFDILFRADVEGALADRPVRIETEELENGRKTTWRADGLPLPLAAHWIGGPFRWIRSGLLDVHVDDMWARRDVPILDCHWHLTLRDVEVEVPSDAGRLEATAARATAAWLTHRARPLDLAFDLTLDESDFAGATTLAQTVLLDKVAQAVHTLLAKLR